MDWMPRFRFQSLLKGSTFLLIFTVISGCAFLHHVQVGQVDNRAGMAQIPFEVLVSETGVSAEEIGDIARSTRSKGGDDAGRAADTLALFQMGPRTGNPVYSENYARKLIYQIHEKCPSGNITGLVSIREMRKYPAISGEIVKVTGYCLKARKPSSVNNETNSESEQN